MRISARCGYACKALLELALHWPSKEPLQIHAISDRQNIPIGYLIHILLQLKRLGFLTSSRGKDGGYNLSRSPGSISLGELMRCVGGPLLPLANLTTEKDSVFAAIWKEAEYAMAKVLDEVTFADISDRARGAKEAIMYQI